MSVKIDKGRLSGGLEITPLIDVVFLMLTFFLVASKLEEADRSIDVVLPRASEAKPLTSRPREFVINVDAAGSLFAGAEKVDSRELAKRLEQAVADNPVNLSVVVRADENVAHKHVVAAMNACVQAGVTDYKVQSAVPP